MTHCLVDTRRSDSDGELKVNKDEPIDIVNDKCKLKFNHWLCDIVQLKQYLCLFQENECNDIRMVQDFDDDILKNEIGIAKTLHRKLILRKSKEFSESHIAFQMLLESDNELKQYKQQFEINGILTLKDFKNDIKSTQQLSQILNIKNKNKINVIWKNIVCSPKQIENEEKMSVVHHIKKFSEKYTKCYYKLEANNSIIKGAGYCAVSMKGIGGCNGRIIYAELNKNDSGYNKGIYFWSVKLNTIHSFRSVGVTTEMSKEFVEQFNGYLEFWPIHKHGSCSFWDGYNAQWTYEEIITVKLNCDEWTVTYFRNNKKVKMDHIPPNKSYFFALYSCTYQGGQGGSAAKYQIVESTPLLCID
eukprot:255880_1